jgi:hypothetical protein
VLLVTCLNCSPAACCGYCPAAKPPQCGLYAGLQRHPTRQTFKHCKAFTSWALDNKSSFGSIPCKIDTGPHRTPAAACPEYTYVQAWKQVVSLAAAIVLTTRHSRQSPAPAVHRQQLMKQEARPDSHMLRSLGLYRVPYTNKLGVQGVDLGSTPQHNLVDDAAGPGPGVVAVAARPECAIT